MAEPKNPVVGEVTVVQKTLAVVITMLLVGLVVSGVSADASASQTVTIRIEAVDVIGVGPVEPIGLSQSGETDLKWTTNTAESRKVSVRVDHVPAGLKLKVEALIGSLWGEHSQLPVGAGEVTLDSNTKQYELIGAVWAGAGGCKVRYTAEVVDVAEQGVSDVAEVSFILTTSSRAPLSVSSHQLTIGQGLPGLSLDNDQTVAYAETAYITITDTE